MGSITPSRRMPSSSTSSIYSSSRKSELSDVLNMIAEIAALESTFKDVAEKIIERRKELVEMAKDLSPELKTTLKSMGVTIDEAKTLDELLDEDTSFSKINKIYKNREDISK